MSTFEDTTKAVLTPRNPGEDIKIRETVLARRDRNIKAKALNAKKIQAERKAKRSKKVEDKLISAASLVKKALTAKKDRNRLKRLDKGKKIKATTEANGNVITVVRNRKKNPTRRVAAALKEMGLDEKSNLVFLAHTEETLKKLKLAAPFCFWGFPTFKTVKDLLHKKAFFKVEKKAADDEGKVLLNSNALIEEHLGESCGLLCVEDLVQCIYKCEQPQFDAVKGKLCPVPIGDYNSQKAEGFKVETKLQLFGDQQRKINDVIKTIL